MKNRVFMNIKHIGNLYIFDVLLHYIYPRIFVCEDEFGSKYLFYEITEDTSFDKWLITKIRKNDYFDIIDGKNQFSITIETIFIW